jgi:hypothetical protein
MLRFRTLEREDQARLWDWLHIALWDPPPAPLRPRELLQSPHVRICAETWGQPGDFGKELMLAGLQAASAAGYKNVSLTVHPLNPAILMYEGCGFVKREIRNSYHLMVAHVA